MGLPEATSPRFSVGATVLRYGLAARLAWLGMALLFVPPGIFTLLPIGVYRAGSALLSWSAVVGVGTLFVAAVIRVVSWKRHGDVRIEHGALRWGEGLLEKSVPLKDLKGGRASPADGCVELDLVNGDVVRFRALDRGEGAALLEATGLDASRRAVTFGLGETLFLDLLSILLGPIAATYAAMASTVWHVRVLSYSVFFLAWAVVFFGLRALFGPERLVVGADGVVVKRTLRSKFIPHSAIKDVRVTQSAVKFELESGAEVSARARHLTPVRRSEIEARIAETLQVFRKADAPEAALARLDRGGRTLDEWRASLAALLSTGESYRARTLDKDALVSVVESPGAPLERRVAAAVALAALGDAAATERVRVAAAASANVRVRVALEQASAGELDERALEEASAEEEALAAKAARA